MKKKPTGELPDDELRERVERAAPPLRAVVKDGRLVFLDKDAMDPEARAAAERIESGSA